MQTGIRILASTQTAGSRRPLQFSSRSATIFHRRLKIHWLKFWWVYADCRWLQFFPSGTGGSLPGHGAMRWSAVGAAGRCVSGGGGGVSRQAVRCQRVLYRCALSLSLSRQVEQIETVFTSAGKQKAWDHFTKAQRKNLVLWSKQCQVGRLRCFSSRRERARATARAVRKVASRPHGWRRGGGVGGEGWTLKL